MASHSEKPKVAPIGKWLLLVYLGIISILFLLFSLNLWWANLLDLVLYISNPSASPLSSVSVDEGLDALVLLVLLVEFVGLSLLLGFSLWFLRTVVDFARGKIGAYRDLLTVAVGLPILSFIVVAPNQALPADLQTWILNLGQPLNAFLEHVNLLMTILTLLNLALIMGIVHYHYYPEYRKMSPLEVLRDLRVIRVGLQIIFAVFAVFIIFMLINNVYNSLVANNIVPNFDFVYRRAGINISESPDWYSSNSRFGDAFIVGMLNTINVVWLGLLLSTIIGIFLGILLLSRNWLIRNLSNIYVEILRNTPLLVQLVFWYFVFWLSLPEDGIELPAESVLVVWLRFFPYLFTLIGIWLYAWRFPAPPKLFNGVLTGIFLAEIVFRVLGANYFTIILLAVLGATTIFAAKRQTIPSSQEGLAWGFGILGLSQFAGHLVLSAMEAMQIIPAAYVFGEIMPVVYITDNRVAMPAVFFTLRFGLFVPFVIAGIIVAAGIFAISSRIIERTGQDIPRSFYAFLGFLAVCLLGWYLVAMPIPDDFPVGFGTNYGQAVAEIESQIEAGDIEAEDLRFYTHTEPFFFRLPVLNNFGRVLIGNDASPSYMALLVGLVVYTSAFIGEIVRAGIQAVPYGQIEAARALGLSTSQSLQMIILPQALRVIVPPLGNQYLNLAKNSTLAISIAFADTYQIGQSIMSTSGQSVAGFLIILGFYLTMSLVISFVMNIVNGRFQLVTR